MSEITRTRAPRSDALRNRQHILDIARQHFAEHGVSGSLDAIAKDAGVGPGTLYRHFPSRDALLAALLTARDEEIGIRRDAIISSTSDAGDALSQWLEALIEWAGAFDGLPEPLRAALGEIPSPLTSTCEGYIVVTDAFLDRARAEGLARDDVRGRDLFLLALAVSWARGAAMADAASPASMAGVLRSGWAAGDAPTTPIANADAAHRAQST
ncbi:TetR/AcrR family transcriptional regulator [Microbacterium sp. NPDC090003]|uniref:TetR/AcrR family transcriptional regulator n=1 Tax=Microbacterium sp. NPDC090003 TaxID=3364203 RepID=UPI0038264389